MRIGIFGGTFDPVHQGHLILAEQCREQGKLDQVWFIPAPRPPHKEERALTPFDKRVEMLALAIAGHAAFKVDELEKDRPGPSYTVETLEAIQKRCPESELLLLLGSDSLRDLSLWHQPKRIAELAGLLVMARPGATLLAKEEVHRGMGLEPAAPLGYQVVQAPLIDIASRDLRRRAAEGRSLRYLVPRAVEMYIGEKGLYAASAQGKQQK